MAPTDSDNSVDLSRNLGFLLNRGWRLLRDDVDLALKPLRLTVHEYAVMRIIENGKAETQQDVARRYGLDPSSMVELVDRLAERQLLLRERNEFDRRSYRLSLTPKGRKTLSRARRIADAELRRFVDVLSESELESLYVILWKLVSSKPLR
ncbi:MAG: MarR family transcriptional regulator [Candidatus Obscuribacterales bacterium]|nr:MarR family transcriptional regulator [Candidatus Obscuribacterales bacterium]